MTESTPRFLGMSAARAAGAVIAVATIFRLFYCAWLPMLPDETYYFQWSRHLDASYFSKGPAVAYTIWLGTKCFGDNAFGIRFFAVLLSAGTAWQIFLLARRWYDATAGLIAVLLAGVIPLYAVGAVLMTIDPLSAFFWVWAANFFSKALGGNRTADWILAGFAVGSGFLAKYLNALELLGFVFFLVLAPGRRRSFAQRGFWLMLASFLICTLPVIWWNAQHDWASATQLGDRGHVHDAFQLRFSTLLDFFGSQAVVISPLLFGALLVTAMKARGWVDRTKLDEKSEGEFLLLLLFLSVFVFYLFMALHIRCEPNWPAVSYLSLIVILAGHWRDLLASGWRRGFMALAFCMAWIEMVALHDTKILPLPAHADPMGRTAGWSEIAGRLEAERKTTGADTLLADGYKEASVVAYYLPDRHFVYALRHAPPANQFDLWPTFAMEVPQRVLWITDDQPPQVKGYGFTKVAFLERVQIWFRGAPLRAYRIYLCEGPGRGAAP